MSDRRYSRIYHEAVDDPKFAEVWDDDARLALWVRLLVMADQAWPASAVLPRSVKRRSLDALVACGLVDLSSGDRFRIHGMDPERARRSDAAAHAAQSRWHTDGNADSNAPRNAETMPNRKENRKEDKRVVRGENGALPRAKHDDLHEQRKAALEKAYPDYGLSTVEAFERSKRS